MPRAWDSELISHINGDLLTVATCWKVTRQDGEVFLFTDHDKDILLELDVSAGLTERYLAATGYSRSSIMNKSDYSVDSVDTQGPIESILDTLLTSTAITQRDLEAGLFDDATVVLFTLDWRNSSTLPLESEIGILRSGNLGAVSMKDNLYDTELRGLMQQLQTNTGKVYSPLCRVDLFSTECGLTASEFVMSGTVDSVTSNREFAAAARVTLRPLPVPTSNRDALSLTDQLQVIENEDDGTFTSTLATPDGTEDNPILVSTITHVNNIRNSPHLHYRLTANVDMTAHGLFEPIPGFSGTLDGAGFEIQNLNLNDTAGSARTGNGYGFIGTLTQGGVVKRLGLTLGGDVRPAAGSAVPVGAMIGRLLGTVQDCYALGTANTINADDTSGSIGGFVGEMRSHPTLAGVFYADVPRPGTITRCYCAVGLSGVLDVNDGGFAGWLSPNATETNTYFDSDVAGTTQVGFNSTATALTTVNIQNVANLTGFDFDTVWGSAAGYKLLLDPGRSDMTDPFLRYAAIDLTSLTSFQTGSVDWTSLEPGSSGIDIYVSKDGSTWTVLSPGPPPITLPGALWTIGNGLVGEVLHVRVDFKDSGSDVPTLQTLIIDVQGQPLTFQNVPLGSPPPVDLTPSDPDWFVGGLVTFTSGKNTGLAREVKAWTPGTLTFQTFLQFPFTVQDGDQFTAHPGCKKRVLLDCKAKFNNILNNRSEPFVPGLDKLMSIPDSQSGSGSPD